MYGEQNSPEDSHDSKESSADICSQGVATAYHTATAAASLCMAPMETHDPRIHCANRNIANEIHDPIMIFMTYLPTTTGWAI